MAARFSQSEWPKKEQGGSWTAFYNITLGSPVICTVFCWSAGQLVSSLQHGKDSTGTWVPGDENLQGSSLRLAITVILQPLCLKCSFPDVSTAHTLTSSSSLLKSHLTPEAFSPLSPQMAPLPPFYPLYLLHFSLESILQTYLFIICSLSPHRHQ